MLRFLDGRATVRKMRLFVIACCRRVEHLLTEEDEPGRQALQLAERMVDEQVMPEEVRSVYGSANYASFSLIDGWRHEPDLNARSKAISAMSHALQECNDTVWHSHASKRGRGWRNDFMEAPGRAREAVLHALRPASDPWIEKLFSDSWTKEDAAAFASFHARHKEVAQIEEQAQIAILRDICGNPFRRLTIDQSWLDWSDGIVRTTANDIYEESANDMKLLESLLMQAGCTNSTILDHCGQPGKHVRGCWVIDLLLGKA
jgi:hypothetical protein